MILADIAWAQGEFLKLGVSESRLMLEASPEHLNELKKSLNWLWTPMPVPTDRVWGMDIVICESGWRVRDAEGNTITR